MPCQRMQRRVEPTGGSATRPLLLQAREASEAALAALKAQYEAAWLPHWVEVRSRSAVEALGPAFQVRLPPRPGLPGCAAS